MVYHAGYTPGRLPLNTTCHSAPRKLSLTVRNASISASGVGLAGGGGVFTVGWRGGRARRLPKAKASR